MRVKKERKLKKSIATVLGVFIFSLIFLFGHAMVSFWSGASFNWEESIFSPDLDQKTIIIDPGHGGRDPGVIYRGITEEAINLSIAEKLAQLLERKGAKVYMTRTVDGGIVADKVISLEESKELLTRRKDMAIDQRASLFISLHVNSLDNSSARGPIVFFQDNIFLNRILADNIQQKINILMESNRTSKEAAFVVLTQDTVPAVLVETGFVTNPQDLGVLNSDDGQRKMADALLKGIEEFCSYLDELQKIKKEQEKGL